MSRVLGAIARRHQHLNLLAHQLLGRITEESFRLRIREHNAALLIHYQHRIGRSIEYGAEVLAYRDFHKLSRLSRDCIRVADAFNQENQISQALFCKAAVVLTPTVLKTLA